MRREEINEERKLVREKREEEREIRGEKGRIVCGRPTLQAIRR